MANNKNDNRSKPGSKGEGDYYHVELREADEFDEFRYQDVGDEGGLQRLAGKKDDGEWETVKWIVEKDMAHIEGDELVPDHQDAKKMFEQEFDGKPKKQEGDRFKTSPKRSS